MNSTIQSLSDNIYMIWTISSTSHNDGDNMMFCNNCQQLANSSYTTEIYSTPEILILILNRGKGNEFKIKINFYKIIFIGQYVE